MYGDWSICEILIASSCASNFKWNIFIFRNGDEREFGRDPQTRAGGGEMEKDMKEGQGGVS